MLEYRGYYGEVFFNYKTKSNSLTIYDRYEKTIVEKMPTYDWQPEELMKSYLDKLIINKVVKDGGEGIMKTTIINMTPHAINLMDENGNNIITFEPSGNLIRLEQSVKRVKVLNMEDGTEVPISKNVYGDPEGLPNFRAGVYYIVSGLVKVALPDRDDLLVPSEVLRNEKGQVIGCMSLGI